MLLKLKPRFWHLEVTSASGKEHRNQDTLADFLEVFQGVIFKCLYNRFELCSGKSDNSQFP